MITQISSLGAILFSTTLFLMGNGLIGTLTPLRADQEGFSVLVVGALGACYFGGLMAGCLAMPHLLARVGHIRNFAVCAAGAAISVLLLPLLAFPVAWLILRAATGFCIAGLFMALESWLNDRASNETRGSILSIYIVVNMSSLMLGQWLLLLAPPETFALFSIGAVLYCLCLVPVGLTRLPQPKPLPATPIRPAHLFRISPVGAAGCMTVGLANGAFWTLAPVYGQSLEFTTQDLALFMTAFIVGGALIQYPLGRISDHMDRRWVIAAICTTASFCGLVLGLFGWLLIGSPSLLYALVFILGATMLPLYSISIAHANDRLPREKFVEASAGLLFLSVALSVPGPILAAIVISAAGPHALFLFTALAHAAMAFFAFTRTRIREAPANETRESFSYVLQGTPAVLDLDPRGPEQPKPEN